MVPKIFVGVDISKLTLDVALLYKEQSVRSFKINNAEDGIRQLLAQLKEEYGYKPREIVFCAEHMGIYAQFLTTVLAKKKIALYLETPLRIKRSLGIQRGKNDKLDAIRIAQYVKKYYLNMKAWEAPRDCVQQLKALYTIRKRLLKIKKMLVTPGKVSNYYIRKTDSLYFDHFYLSSTQSVIGDIESIEKKMKEIIEGDDKLDHYFKLITSVPRIGPVIATQMLVYTNEFRDITCPKKFASFCGIAPFEYRSGTSLTGKARVSYLANQEIKPNLHLAALGVTRMRGTFLHDYYMRKVAEGKNKMAILNAIRNKLIHRIFSCIHSDTIYVDIDV